MSLNMQMKFGILVSCLSLIACMPIRVPPEVKSMEGRCLETKQDYWVNYYHYESDCLPFEVFCTHSPGITFKLENSINAKALDHERLPKGTKLYITDINAYWDAAYGDLYYFKLKHSNFKLKDGTILHEEDYKRFFFKLKGSYNIPPTWDKTKLKDCVR
ncbi:MAG: hypothetical protein ACHQAX_07960 [Gammaproteobacteria bacterium]